MSGYVPFNGPIGVAMIATSSTPGLLLWAWVNQSHNAMVNYFNRGSAGETHAIDVDWEHDIPSMFRQIDVRGTGKLDRADIHALAKRITKVEDKEEELDAAMARLDLDGDGNITLPEFTSWFEA